MVDPLELKRLLSQGLLTESEVKQKFEESFGKDSETRTAEQWSNLVTAYGVQVVARQEKLTEAQVIERTKKRYHKKIRNAKPLRSQLR